MFSARLVVLFVVNLLVFILLLPVRPFLWALERYNDLTVTTNRLRRVLAGVLLVPAFVLLLASFPAAHSDSGLAAGLTAAGFALACCASLLLFGRIKRKTPAATLPSPPAPAPTPQAADRSDSAGAGRPPTDGAS